ncbi:hypothetical protein TWF718_003543 [Orbilia javanica]|uniref:Uncharacterized protein n=1 Tax=Orbilia javanica TaxID=47235 RepID=A0AAN8MPE3_9PEZI
MSNSIFARFFVSRLRFSAVVFLLGFVFGHLISEQRILLFPELSPLGSLPSSLEDTNVGDYYCLPPLNEPRYPSVPSYNALPTELLTAAQDLISQTPITPLFVPFTRNHLMIRQTILSYIAAGWPPSQIFIIDNSGTMDANLHGLLSDTNPFHLNYTLYRSRYGVNIMRTPTLLSFAQLQNLMLFTAMAKGWSHYYWTHQDIAVLSDEDKRPYKSLYENVLSSLISLYPTMNLTTAKRVGQRWGIVWYSFDWLTLVNVAAATEGGVGAWDTFIPYYHTDCDYYERLRLMDFPILEKHVGEIYDLAEHITDPEYRFFGDEENGTEVESARFKMLKMELNMLMKAKAQSSRNTWQDELKGGEGEPWTYDPKGFQTAWWDMASAGRAIFKKKWGTSACKPSNDGKTLSRMWNETNDSKP